MSTQTPASRVPEQRPWEPWFIPNRARVPIGLAGGALAILVLAMGRHFSGFFVISLATLVAEWLAWLYLQRFGERLTAWRRVDEALHPLDPYWRSRMPAVRRTPVGLVMTLAPVPGVTDRQLEQALRGVARQYGLHLIAHEVELPPAGFVRQAVGHERLKIEMAR